MQRIILIILIVLLAIGIFAMGRNPRRMDDEQSQKFNRDRALLSLRQRSPEVIWRFDDNNCIATIEGENLTAPSQEEPVEIALKFIEEHSALFRLENPREELEVNRLETDELGLTHIRFDQVYDGLKVRSCQLGVHLRSDGSVYYFNGTYFPTPDINTVPFFTLQEGIEIAKEHYLQRGKTSIVDATGELMIFSHDGETFHLVWQVMLQGESLIDSYEYYIDAHDGDVLHFVTRIRGDGPVTGSGMDNHGVSRSVNLYQEGSNYYFLDTTKPMYRPPAHEFNGVIAVVDFENTTESFDLLGTTSTTISDRAAVDVSYATSLIYDFFNDLVGLNSWDNRGGTIRVGVRFGLNMNNAVYSSSANLMAFGNGDGTRFHPFSRAWDIIAHEYGHGITHHSAGLIYENQPGALDEAYCDLAGVTIDSTTWMMGQHVMMTAGTATRYLDNPHRADMPAHMSEYRHLPNTPEGDYGGVHINMSIPNLAFVRMVDHAPNFRRSEAYIVWYRALRHYLNERSQFMDARDNVLRAARDIYASDPRLSDIECGIQDAFAFVGLGTGCDGTGGDEGGEWVGDFIYYWNDDAEDYYLLTTPDIDNDQYGLGVQFTIPPGGYNLVGLYYYIFDVWTLYDLDFFILDNDFEIIASNTVSNDYMWRAVYGDSMAIPFVGADLGITYEGDIYALTWLDGEAIEDDYVAFGVDDATGTGGDRNFAFIWDWDAFDFIVADLEEVYGAPYNIISFAIISRLEGIEEEKIVLLPNGLKIDLVASPTPFNSSVNLSYELPGSGKLVISDINGREVYRNSSLDGNGTIVWDAQSDSVRELPSGTYIVTLTSDDIPVPISRKILYLK